MGMHTLLTTSVCAGGKKRLHYNILHVYNSTILTYLISLSKFLNHISALVYWKSSPIVIKILLVL